MTLLAVDTRGHSRWRHHIAICGMVAVVRADGDRRVGICELEGWLVGGRVWAECWILDCRFLAEGLEIEWRGFDRDRCVSQSVCTDFTTRFGCRTIWRWICKPKQPAVELLDSSKLLDAAKTCEDGLPENKEQLRMGRISFAQLV